MEEGLHVYEVGTFVGHAGVSQAGEKGASEGPAEEGREEFPLARTGEEGRGKEGMKEKSHPHSWNQFEQNRCCFFHRNDTALEARGAFWLNFRQVHWRALWWVSEMEEYLWLPKCKGNGPAWRRPRPSRGERLKSPLAEVLQVSQLAMFSLCAKPVFTAGVRKPLCSSLGPSFQRKGRPDIHFSLHPGIMAW